MSLLERKYYSVLYIIASKLDRALEAFDNIRENIEYMGEEKNFKILNNNAEHSIRRTFYGFTALATLLRKTENPFSLAGDFGLDSYASFLSGK